MEYGVCFDNNTGTIYRKTDNNLVYFKRNEPQLSDIYYGNSIYPQVTEDIILTTFSYAPGYVGTLAGTHYMFAPVYSYKYWCIPDYPNDGNNGEKLIEHIASTETGDYITVYYDSYYHFYQINPTPITSITYGKIDIAGTTYRVYRTWVKYSYTDLYVFSFAI